MNFDGLIQFYYTHKGGIIGGTAGFVIAVSMLLLGFFKFLFIAICVAVGYYVGKRLHEDKEYLRNLLDRVLPPGTYR